MVESLDDSIERNEFEALKERVDYLEEKVAFLEGETDEYYEEHQFERQVESLVRGDDVDIETQDNQVGGYYARINDISVDSLNRAIEILEFNDRYNDLEWKMTETGTGGIGLEIWTQYY